ncbi:inhibitor of growth protein 1 isoform X2 [Thrips palmi]|uniref:Inhibitor of growth protein n=1 Tax=Thrips palmi TaxID=161013 RepID=A0A6P8ZWQ8_THRPL|nr:inhibitor of growth protein 1 isoform X2 [Thrips palmi]
MLNQAAVEALYSATYVENYLDCTENLPDELQRHLSRMRELDVEYQSFMRRLASQLEAVRNSTEDSAQWRRALLRAQKELIAAQEVGDEKLHIMSQLQEHIDNKVRQMDIDLRNLDYGKEQETNDTGKENQTASSGVNAGSTRADNGTSGSGATGERSSKRARRGVMSQSDTATNSPDVPAAPEVPTRREGAPARKLYNYQATVSNPATGKKAAAGTGKNKKKRKSRGSSSTAAQSSSQAVQEQTPPRDDELAIDPDEPTYCLCDQISFGEMILCDNDLCPIEWFHFGCVALTTKPKGKWFCPKCRGDRPNVMKPKAQFLKELERYNKEKEEKS